MGVRYETIAGLFQPGGRVRVTGVLGGGTCLSMVVTRVSPPAGSGPFKSFSLSSEDEMSTLDMREEDIAEVREGPAPGTIVVRMDDGSEYLLESTFS